MWITITVFVMSVHVRATGDFNPEDLEEDVIQTEPKADYQAVGESEPVTNKAPIVLGPPPPSSGEPSSEDVVKQEEEVEQEGVVSVQVSEQESDDVGRGSDEQLIVTEQN